MEASSDVYFISVVASCGVWFCVCVCACAVVFDFGCFVMRLAHLFILWFFCWTFHVDHFGQRHARNFTELRWNWSLPTRLDGWSWAWCCLELSCMNKVVRFTRASSVPSCVGVCPCECALMCLLRRALSWHILWLLVRNLVCNFVWGLGFQKVSSAFPVWGFISFFCDALFSGLWMRAGRGPSINCTCGQGVNNNPFKMWTGS